jgi:hypothetical protein
MFFCTATLVDSGTHVPCAEDSCAALLFSDALSALGGSVFLHQLRPLCQAEMKF